MCASVKGVLDAMDQDLQVVFEPCDMNSRSRKMLVLFNSTTIVEPSLQPIDNGFLVNNVKYLKVDYNIICSVDRLWVSNNTCSIRNSLVLGHWLYRSLLGTLLTCENQVTHCCGSCHVHHSLCSSIPGSDLYSPWRSWPNLSPVVAKYPLLRMAVLKIGSRLKPMISSSFPTGKPFQQRTENWDITDFTK